VLGDTDAVNGDARRYISDNVGMHFYIALGKCETAGDFDGELKSARECVRIYDKLGINNETSQSARDILLRLEGVE
jgi:hypothetical protein